MAAAVTCRGHPSNTFLNRDLSWGGVREQRGWGGRRQCGGTLGGTILTFRLFSILGGSRGRSSLYSMGSGVGVRGGAVSLGRAVGLGVGGTRCPHRVPVHPPPPPKCSVPPELADSAVPWVEGGGLGPPTGPLAQRTRAGGGGCSRNCLLGSRGRGSSGGASAEPERNLGCNGTGEVGKRGVSCGVGGRGGEARPHGWRGSHLGGQRGGHVGRQRAAGRAQL